MHAGLAKDGVNIVKCAKALAEVLNCVFLSWNTPPPGVLLVVPLHSAPTLVCTVRNYLFCGKHSCKIMVITIYAAFGSRNDCKESCLCNCPMQQFPAFIIISLDTINILR